MGNTSLAQFLALSIEMETEARERYLELAEAMGNCGNGEVAQFFSRMAEESSLHLQEVQELAGGMALDIGGGFAEGEGPETTDRDAVVPAITLRQAMLLALDNERAAEKFYASFAETSKDAETRQVAARFAAEEATHGAQLAAKLSKLPA